MLELRRFTILLIRTTDIFWVLMKIQTGHHSEQLYKGRKVLLCFLFCRLGGWTWIWDSNLSLHECRAQNVSHCSSLLLFRNYQFPQGVWFQVYSSANLLLPGRGPRHWLLLRASYQVPHSQADFTMSWERRAKTWTMQQVAGDYCTFSLKADKVYWRIIIAFPWCLVPSCSCILILPLVNPPSKVLFSFFIYY